MYYSFLFHHLISIPIHSHRSLPPSQPSNFTKLRLHTVREERKVREERTPRDFYTGLLKPELHPVCQGNLSLTLHYFKSFTKYPPLHFQNMQKHHKILLNHTRITPKQQEPSCRPGKPPATHTKFEKDQTLVVAQPSLPQTTFSKLKTKPKAPRIDPRSIFNRCNTYDHKGESFHKFSE